MIAYLEMFTELVISLICLLTLFRSKAESEAIGGSSGYLCLSDILPLLFRSKAESEAKGGSSGLYWYLPLLFRSKAESEAKGGSSGPYWYLPLLFRSKAESEAKGGNSGYLCLSDILPLLFRSKAESEAKGGSSGPYLPLSLTSCLSCLDPKLIPRQKEAVLAISAPLDDMLPLLFRSKAESEAKGGSSGPYLPLSLTSCLSCLDPKLNPKQNEAVLAISAPLTDMLPLLFRSKAEP
jgi:stalled ribosome alternative rescue factor ArfA